MSDERKQIKELKKLAEKQGWTIRVGSDGHACWYDQGGDYVAWCGGTPRGGRRTIENLRAELRRGGLQGVNARRDGRRK